MEKPESVVTTIEHLGNLVSWALEDGFATTEDFS